MKRAFKAIGNAALLGGFMAAMVVTIWDDREQLFDDARQFKRAWITPGKRV